jgi:hypothetical protein
VETKHEVSWDTLLGRTGKFPNFSNIPELITPYWMVRIGQGVTRLESPFHGLSFDIFMSWSFGSLDVTPGKMQQRDMPEIMEHP